MNTRHSIVQWRKSFVAVGYEHVNTSCSVLYVVSGIIVFVCDLNTIIIPVLNVELMTWEAQIGVAGTFNGTSIKCNIAKLRGLTELVLRVLRFCGEYHSMWPCCSCHWWWTDQRWRWVSDQRPASAVSGSFCPLRSLGGRLYVIHLHMAARG